MNGWLESVKPLIHVFVHPKRYLLSTYYESGTMLGTGDSTVNKTTVDCALLELTFWWGIQTINKKAHK